jgi:hypothetical protein
MASSLEDENGDPVRGGTRAYQRAYYKANRARILEDARLRRRERLAESAAAHARIANRPDLLDAVVENLKHFNNDEEVDDGSGE